MEGADSDDDEGAQQAGIEDDGASLARSVLAGQRGLLAARSAEELLAAAEELPC